MLINFYDSEVCRTFESCILLLNRYGASYPNIRWYSGIDTHGTSYAVVTSQYPSIVFYDTPDTLYIRIIQSATLHDFGGCRHACIPSELALFYSVCSIT